MTKTKKKTVPDCMEHVGRGTISDGCKLPGKYDGKCWRHRALTPAEKVERAATAKAALLARLGDLTNGDGPSLATYGKVKAGAGPERPDCHPEVWEQLWAVVDAARMAVCPVRGQTRDDALSFLADQEKMLRRALSFFAGRHGSGEGRLGAGEHHEGWLRRNMDTHPYVLAMRKQDRDLLHADLESDGYVLQADGTYRQVYNEYNPRLTGQEALDAQNDPNKPDAACCNNERRGINGGCANCGDPCL
jgi:hypothetical protein